MTVDLHSLRLRLTVLGLAVMAVVGWRYSYADVIALAAWSERHWLLTVVALSGLFLVRPLFLWPLSVLSVFVGYRFGVVAGLPILLAGTVITCLPPFLVAASADTGSGYLSMLAEHGKSLVDVTGGLRGMVAARLSPAPADAVSYGAGVANVSLGAFVGGTILGELPWALLYLTLGQSLRTFSAGAIGRVGAPPILIGTVVALSLVAGPLYRHLRSQT